MKLFHGSPCLFKAFDLSGAGDGTGIKFGFGVYLTEVEASAVHYSQPRHLKNLTPEHYLYTVEIPDLAEDNHIVSGVPVSELVLSKVEDKLGMKVPTEVTSKGLELRKWLGCQLTGAKKAGFAEEKAAAEWLDSIGIYYNVWPTAQTKPDGPKNIAVFNAERVKIVKCEKIDIQNRCKKWVLVEGSKQTIFEQ